MATYTLADAQIESVRYVGTALDLVFTVEIVLAGKSLGVTVP